MKTYYIKINGEKMEEYPTLEEAKENLDHWTGRAEIWKADIVITYHIPIFNKLLLF